MQLEPRTYIIAAGDTLQKIALRNKLPSWRIIYNAECNRSLRLSPPDKIKVGNRIYIPPKASELAAFRIERLKKLQEENENTFRSILSEWNREYQKVNKISTNVDVAADLILLFKGLSDLCLKGHKVLKLEGEALAKASSSFVRSFAFDKMQYLSELTIKASNFTQVTGEESTGLLLTKVVIQSWFDMTTPSYWAQRFSGVNIEELNRKTKDQITSQQRAVHEQLDKRIAEAQQELTIALKIEKEL
jgi:hypothetical protein